MFEWIASPEAWLALVTLTALEIVLGIDNIIFLSILVGRLPEDQRNRARIQGLALAMLTRIALLLSLAWMMRLTTPFVSVLEQDISGRDLILLFGGLFLLWKSAQEIWDSLRGAEGEQDPAVLGQLSVGQGHGRRDAGAEREPVGEHPHLVEGLKRRGCAGDADLIHQPVSEPRFPRCQQSRLSTYRLEV